MITKSLPLVFFIILSLLNADSSSAQVQWRLVGKKGFSDDRSLYPTIAFDNAGKLYAAFTRDLNDELVVMSFNGNSWDTVGRKDFSKGVARHNCMAFDSENTPYIVHSTWQQDKTSVFKYDGNDWVSVGKPSFTSGTLGTPALCINSSDIPYIAFSDGNRNGVVRVMMFDGNQWHNVGTGDITTRSGNYNQMFIDPLTQDIYVGFRRVDNNNGRYYPNVMKFDGSTWQQVGKSDFYAGSIASFDMAKDPTSNKIYVAFADESKGDLATVMVYDGNDWSVVDTAGVSAGKAEYLTLTVNNKGEPLIAYRDLGNDYKGCVKKFDGLHWVYVGPPAFTTPTRVHYTYITSNASSVPYIIFMDTDSNFKSTVMKYSAPDTSVGLSNLLPDNEIILYPNPANDYLIVKGINQETHIDIYNTFGQHVYSTSMNQNNNSINIKGLSSGDYFIIFGASSQILRFTKL